MFYKRKQLTLLAPWQQTRLNVCLLWIEKAPPSPPQDEDGEKVEEEVLEEGEEEGEEEEEESDVVRELLSKHSAWLGVWKKNISINEYLTFIPSDLLSKTYFLIWSEKIPIAPFIWNPMVKWCNWDFLWSSPY
jgi:hypothetical protein